MYTYIHIHIYICMYACTMYYMHSHVRIYVSCIPSNCSVSSKSHPPRFPSMSLEASAPGRGWTCWNLSSQLWVKNEGYANGWSCFRAGITRVVGLRMAEWRIGRYAFWKRGRKASAQLLRNQHDLDSRNSKKCPHIIYLYVYVFCVFHPHYAVHVEPHGCSSIPSAAQ